MGGDDGACQLSSVHHRRLRTEKEPKQSSHINAVLGDIRQLVPQLRNFEIPQLSTTIALALIKRLRVFRNRFLLDHRGAIVCGPKGDDQIHRWRATPTAGISGQAIVWRVMADNRWIDAKTS